MWNGDRDYALRAWKMNYLAGSIFGLEPGTPYEVKVALADPDSKNTVRTLSVTTRAVPAIPTRATRASRSRAAAALGGRRTRRQTGRLLRGAWRHLCAVPRYGQRDGSIYPIVILGAGDGEVVIVGHGASGIQVAGSYVHLHKLTVKGFISAARQRRHPR